MPDGSSFGRSFCITGDPKAARKTALAMFGALAALLLAACGGGAPAAGLNGGPTPMPAVKADTRVIADGHVVPVVSADLSFPATGIVDEVLVEEGDRVEAGQLLATLGNARQTASVLQAQAEVQRAQARLDQVKAGSRGQEIASARAAVEIAQAKLDALNAGATPAQIAAAKANVAQAQAVFNKAQSGPNAADIAAAKADMDNAAAKVRAAQAEFDRVGELPGSGASPQALALEQRTNEYNAAKARYESAQRGPNPADVANAKAQLDRAQADLQGVLAPPRAADLAASEAEVRRAQSQLDLLLAGPQAEEVRASEADLAAAQAGLAQAQAALAETELRAPFAGTVAAVDGVVGQQVGPTSPVVRLGDFSNWLIETRDLTELRVVGLRPGDRAVVAFDAIPDLELPGQVIRVRSIGQNTQGDITYTVVVAPDRSDERLLWNMTAKVMLEPGSGPGNITGAAAARATATANALATRNADSRAATATAAAAASAAAAAITSTASAQAIQQETAAAPEPTGTPSPAGPAATAAPVSGAATRRPAATAAPAAPVVPVVAPPILLEPKADASAQGKVVFQWQAGSPLPEGAYYEVVAWLPGQGPADAQGIAAPTTKTSASVNLDVMSASGQFTANELTWTVVVVKKDPYQRLTDPGAGEARRLVYGGPPPTQPAKPRG
jgi:HlyD family secretion protein